MSDLTTALKIAIDAHDSQVDKAGEPYILHPLRVMLSVPAGDARIVAILHDVAEDGESGWQDIHEGSFDERILDAIDAITRREDEVYTDFIQRCAVNELARQVKLADIADNLLPSRSAALPERLRKRYESACAVLAATRPTGEQQ